VDTGNALLKGVSALGGGKAAIIRKQGENVRVVLDPADKPLVATYNNLLGTEGGVVFDAGMARFQTDLTGRLNNRKYVENIADWLEQSSSATAKGSILIYDLSTGDNPLLAKAPLSALGSADRKLVLATRASMPALSPALLAKQSQVWLFFPPGATLGEKELKAVTDFNRSGGALLLVSGGESTGDRDLAGINRLSSGFGVNFYGQATQGEEIPVAVAAPLFYRASEMLGKLLKLTHKA
jgi:hypothetical protein